MKVFGNETALPGAENFGLDKSPCKLLQRHAVVVEKARQGNGGGGEDTEPACRFLTGGGTETEVYAYGQPHANGGAEKLTGRQTEKDCLLVLSDFFWDFNFYNCSPLILTMFVK